MSLTLPSNVEHIERSGIPLSALADQELGPLMRTLATRLIDLHRSSAGGVTFPVNCKAVSIHRKVLAINENANMREHAGSLVPVKGGFYIAIRREDPASRRRWTVAHELGHTYFFDITAPTPLPNILEHSNGVERSCDSFSSELLMPQWSVGNRAHQINLKFEHSSLEEDASYYGVSVQALMIRIRQLDRFRSLTRFILLFENVPNRVSGFARKPRVTASLVARDSGFYIPTNIGADKLGLSGPSHLFQNDSEFLIGHETVSLWSNRSGKFAKTIVPCSARYKLYRAADHASVVGLFEIA